MTLPSDKKPEGGRAREWWIHKEDADSHNEEPSNPEDCIHLVEKSAYDAALVRCESLEEECRVFRNLVTSILSYSSWNEFDERTEILREADAIRAARSGEGEKK